MPSNFVSPTTAKLRAAITTLKVTSVIKIDFHITWNWILGSCRISDLVIVFSCPRLSASIMSVA
jgi:hypothetical protein